MKRYANRLRFGGRRSRVPVGVLGMMVLVWLIMAGGSPTVHAGTSSPKVKITRVHASNGSFVVRLDTSVSVTNPRGK
jgi:hypothetical protein